MSFPETTTVRSQRARAPATGTETELRRLAEPTGGRFVRDPRSHLGSSRWTVETRSIVRSNDAMTPIPVRSALATR